MFTCQIRFATIGDFFWICDDEEGEVCFDGNGRGDLNISWEDYRFLYFLREVVKKRSFYGQADRTVRVL